MITSSEIEQRLIDNQALFNTLFVVQQQFDIIPKDSNHYGISIDFQDISELRDDFINELYDSIVDWVYSSDKYADIMRAAIKKGKSKQAANSEVQRKARQKFRGDRESDKLLVQGQLGELLLFHFIQKFKRAVPLLRKMSITTSKEHERFGADAIHFKIENNKPIIILGEAKTYTSKYQFNKAFEDAVTSIIKTYTSHKKELRLYVHEDFLDNTMNEIAESYLNNNLENVEVHLVSIVVYNETEKRKIVSQENIRQQIRQIIEERYRGFDNGKIDIEKNPVLGRITYIIMPIWKLDELAREFQKKI